MQIDAAAADHGDLQAERVGQPPPVREHGRLEQPIADVGAEGRAGQHEVLPSGQIADRGDDAAVADRLLGDVGPAPAAVWRGRVAGGQPGHGHREIIAEPGGAHAERAEQPVRGELGQRAPAHPPEGRRGEDETAVGVGPPGAGREVEAGLPGQQAQEPRLIHARDRHARQLAQRVVLPQAAGVGQALPQRDRDGQRQLGQVPAHVLVQRQHAVALQQQQAGGGELLARGRDVEDGAGSDRDVMLDHRAAGGRLCHQRAIAVDADRVSRATVDHVRRDQASELSFVHRRHSSGPSGPAPGGRRDPRTPSPNGSTRWRFGR